jgi:hypothetical protein
MLPIRDRVINTKMTGKIFFKPIFFLLRAVLVHLQNYRKDEGLPFRTIREKAI